MLTVNQALKAHYAITRLVESDKTNKFVFPSAVRIKLAGSFRKTREVYEDYKKEHEALVKRLGAPVAGSGNISVKPENLQEFTKENQAMLDAERDITLQPIKVDDLGTNQVEVDLIADLQDVGLLPI